jgi:uncharacterized protein (DUF58 family)
MSRAVLLTGVLVLLAVVLGRVDLVALAAPFAVGAAWSLFRRPAEEPQLELELPGEPPAEGTEVTAVVRVANPNPASFDLVVARISLPRWLPLRHSDRPHATDLGGGEIAEVTFSGPALRWGRHAAGPAVGYAVVADALLVSEVVSTPTGDLRVHPVPPPFRAAETMPRAAALVGPHRSRRPGEGGELAGVRRFAPGDRLRRIDWRTTLRTQEPHVAATWSDRDATVVLLLDVAYEAGVSGGVHGRASVVDTTVRAAAAIAEHYLRQGDRVSMVELSGAPRHLRAGNGRRHLQAALDWLLSTGTTVDADGPPPPLLIDPRLYPSNALVVVLTPLLEPSSAELIAALARAGRVVAAIDTLGDLADRRLVGTQWTPVAQRLWRLERDLTIGQLWEVGVPVTGWAGPGSLDQVLRDLTRIAAAPRIGAR